VEPKFRERESSLKELADKAKGDYGYKYEFP
jgi:hypothetical protein